MVSLMNASSELLCIVAVGKTEENGVCHALWDRDSYISIANLVIDLHLVSFFGLFGISTSEYVNLGMVALPRPHIYPFFSTISRREQLAFPPLSGTLVMRC